MILWNFTHEIKFINIENCSLKYRNAFFAFLNLFISSIPKNHLFDFLNKLYLYGIIYFALRLF